MPQCLSRRRRVCVLDASSMCLPSARVTVAATQAWPAIIKVCASDTACEAAKDGRCVDHPWEFASHGRTRRREDYPVGRRTTPLPKAWRAMRRAHDHAGSRSSRPFARAVRNRGGCLRSQKGMTKRWRPSSTSDFPRHLRHLRVGERRRSEPSRGGSPPAGGP